MLEAGLCTTGSRGKQRGQQRSKKELSSLPISSARVPEPCGADNSVAAVVLTESAVLAKAEGNSIQGRSSLCNCVGAPPERWGRHGTMHGRKNVSGK